MTEEEFDEAQKSVDEFEEFVKNRKRDCIGKFDESSEICLAGCRDCKECAEKSNIKFDKKIKAKIDWKKGKITFKEMVKIVWGIKDNPKPREEKK